MSSVSSLARVCFAADMLESGIDLLNAYLGPEGVKKFRKELKAINVRYHRQDHVGLEKTLQVICSEGACWLLNEDKS